MPPLVEKRVAASVKAPQELDADLPGSQKPLMGFLLKPQSENRRAPSNILYKECLIFYNRRGKCRSATIQSCSVIAQSFIFSF